MIKAPFMAAATLLMTAAAINSAADANVQTTAFRFVDLSPYTRSINETSHRQLPDLAKGVRPLNGVTFQIESPLAVTGIDSARAGEFFPTEIKGITIAASARRIHLLHTALFADKDGTPLAKIVFHYASGREETIRLGYGVHVRDWTAPRLEKTDELLDPNSRLAWSESDERRGDSSRVFQTALENPRPGEMISNIDFISLFSRATPVVFAISIEDPSSRLAANRPLPSRKAVREMKELSDAVYRREVVARVTDAETGAVLTNATATLTITDDKQTYFFGETKTDARGIGRLIYPPQYTVGFGLWVHAPNRVPALVSESKTNASKFKGEYAVALKHGVSIGGIVKSASSKPVAGAEVVFHQVTKTGTRHYTRVDYDAVLTDKDGKWTSSSAPADLTGFTFEVFHPDFRPALYATPGYAPPPANLPGSATSLSSSTTYRKLADGTLVPMTPVRRTAASRSQSVPLVTTNGLLASSAEMILQPALMLEGTLVDNASRPIPATEVIFQHSGLERNYLRTDEKGHFQTRVADVGDAVLLVLKQGFSPLSQNIYVSTNVAPVQLKLEPARVLRGRVLDQRQRPIAGAKIRLDEWNGTTDLLRFQTTSDEQGSFSWTGAPPDHLMFYVSKTNYSSTRQSFAGTMDTVTIRLSRPPGVFGKVYDAETKEPISAFTVIPGRKYSTSDSQIHWERDERVRGQNGEYSLRMSSYYFQPEGRVLVEAMGYEPQVSPPFRNSDSYTNDFMLKKGKGIAGVVQSPDGKPAANAVLVVIEKGDNAYLDTAGQVRSSSGGGDMVRTDPSGRFEFSPKLAPLKIFASHDEGYGEADVSDVMKGGTIVLKKWARVKGVVRVGEKIGPDQNVRLQQSVDYERNYNAETREPILTFSLRSDPDADGSFSFEKVPPGEHRIALEYRLRDNNVYEMALSHGLPIAAKAGETTDVVLGGNGRRVIGRVNVLGGDSSDVDWKRDVHRLTLTLGDPLVPPNNLMLETPAEQQRAWAEFNARQQQFWQSPEGKERQRKERQYVLIFDTNGNFHADNVPPGQYDLAIQVTDPEDEYYNRRYIGTVHRPVTVSNEPDARVNAPVDIGAVDLTIRPRVKIGKVVPSFDGKTADGKTIKLSDYKGKYVLLYFWGRSMGYSTYDFQVLKELQSTYGASGKLMVLGCNLDPDMNTAAQFAKTQGQTWTQVYLGNWNQNPIPGMFGLQGNTACVLIDPEGKLASNQLRGSSIRNAVNSALAGE